MTVVRNAAYTRGSVGVRERHNERKNECYSNADIQLERSAMNVYYKKPETTYEQAFDRLVEDGIIVVKGLKTDGSAKIIDEMIFDVNTSYFEENGGYEFAKKFFEEAYRLAVSVVGDERYILSAVMHADERNVAVSEELGKDVYHYHLHVVYVPIVEKEVYYKKNNKNPELAGKLKEIIQQVSHSKKWPRLTQTDENGEVLRNQKGKAILVNSYSLLQDRFFEHMKDAGFQDFERGKYKSTAKHLSDMEFKLQQDKKRSAKLDKEIESKQNQSAKLDKKIGTQKRIEMQRHELSEIGKKAIFGDEIKLTPKEFKKLKSLARTGIEVQLENDELGEELTKIKSNYSQLRRAYDGLQTRFDKLWDDFRELRDKSKRYFDAVKHAPERVKSFIDGVLGERRLLQKNKGIERDR